MEIDIQNDLEFTAIPSGMSGLEDKYFSFWLEGQLYAIPVHNMVGIVGLMPMRVIPEMPPFMKGIVNLRGDITPIVDLRLRLGRPELPHTDQTSIILVQVHGQQIGYIVDRVEEVSTIPREKFSDSRQIAQEFSMAYLTGVSQHNGTMVLHLDLEQLTGNDDLKVNWN